jgi:hypothetical protein
MPGLDEPIGITRLEFLDEVSTSETTPLMALLTCWWHLSQAGQMRGSDNMLLLKSAESRAIFRCDLYVTFIKGADSATETSTLEPASYCALHGCWASEIQRSELAHEGTGTPGSIIATLQAKDIV